MCKLLYLRHNIIEIWCHIQCDLTSIIWCTSRLWSNQASKVCGAVVTQLQFTDIEFAMFCMHCYLFCELIWENVSPLAGWTPFEQKFCCIKQPKWKYSSVNKPRQPRMEKMVHDKVKVEDKANKICGQYEIVFRSLKQQQQIREKKQLLQFICSIELHSFGEKSFHFFPTRLVCWFYVCAHCTDTGTFVCCCDSRNRNMLGKSNHTAQRKRRSRKVQLRIKKGWLNFKHRLNLSKPSRIS